MKKTVIDSFLSPAHGSVVLAKIKGDGYQYFTILSADGKVCHTGQRLSYITNIFSRIKRESLDTKVRFW